MSDCDRAKSALYELNPSTNRDEWVRIGMAAKAADLPAEDFVEWSRGGSNFKSERDCIDTWKSFKEGSVGAGTLFYLAQQVGWKDPGRPRPETHGNALQSRRPAALLRPRETLQRTRRPVQIDPSDLWERCHPATDEHPYIIAKRGFPDNLRVVPADDPMQVTGCSVSGWLVVPVQSVDGVLQTLQFIPPPGEGQKLNLPGASFSSGMFTMGTIPESNRVFVVEGIGQAWACWAATGQASVACFGAGRMDGIARLLRQTYPDKKLVIVADRGKELQAESIARSVAGSWVKLPTDKPKNYDVNDFAVEFGGDSLGELLDHVQAPAGRFTLLHADEVTRLPSVRWLVRGVLPADGLACIFGASGSGKSFLALDLSISIAMGDDWFGNKVTRAPVVYVALEGEAGIGQRVKAWEAHNNRRPPENLRFVMQPLSLLANNDISDLSAAITASGCGGGLVVVDTLNRAADCADENSSADMGRIIEAATNLQTKCDGVVLLVHHSGKDATKGLRGHSSLRGALDANIEVLKHEGHREWRVDKIKDGDDQCTSIFSLLPIHVGQHDDGDPITSCVVVRDPDTRVAHRVLPPKSGNQRLAWEAARELLRLSSDFGKAAAPAGHPCIALEVLVSATRERLVCEAKRRTERATQAIQGLIGRGLLKHADGWLWSA